MADFRRGDLVELPGGELWTVETTPGGAIEPVSLCRTGSAGPPLAETSSVSAAQLRLVQPSGLRSLGKGADIDHILRQDRRGSPAAGSARSCGPPGPSLRRARHGFSGPQRPLPTSSSGESGAARARHGPGGPPAAPRRRRSCVSRPKISPTSRRPFARPGPPRPAQAAGPRLQPRTTMSPRSPGMPYRYCGPGGKLMLLS